MNRHEEVLAALRRIMRAVDKNSRALQRASGLTAPQLLLMRAISREGSIPVGDLARRLHVSQATVTDIVDRLEGRGLVLRARSTQDRRRVIVTLTDEGARVLARSPEPMQENFIARFQRLQDWEQLQILSSLSRLAEMLGVQHEDAAPVLAVTPLTDTTGVAQPLEGDAGNETQH
jgi:DNA-binding MarR family transcriptional regulator